MPDPAMQLPDLSDRYPLSGEQIAAYRRDGHILLPGVASPGEVTAFRKPIAEYVHRVNRQQLRLDQRDTYHKAFIQIANLWEDDPAVARFTCARRFAGIAAELMGVEGVRLYHDQALFKEPGGGHTPWHQDQYYWPLDTPRTVTMWMPLVDVSAAMGVLTFASESHLEGSLSSLSISEESEEFFTALVKRRKFHIAAAPTRMGHATFHSGWTLHRASPNDTRGMREVMTVIYYANGAHISQPANDHQPADLARWFPGQSPGEAAASRLNPLLYQEACCSD